MMNQSPSVAKSTIDFSALLNSMRTAPTDEGLRAEEIAEQTGIGVGTVRKRLGRAVEMGLVRRAKKTMIRCDGEPARVSSYVICEPEMVVREQVVI